jgi:general secretion pathway protein G
MLIVIVVLGVLATVTVFAVRGITQRGQENACATEMDNLQKGQDVSYTLTGGYGDEAALVSNGSLKQQSSMYDVTSDGASYSIAPASGSSCTATSSGDGGSAGGGSPSGNPASGGSVANVADVITYAGFPAESYKAPGSTQVVLLLDGGQNAELEWDFDDYVNANPPMAGVELVLVDIGYDAATNVPIALAENPAAVVAHIGTDEQTVARGIRSVFGHSYPSPADTDFNLESALDYFGEWVFGSNGGTPVEYAGNWGFQVGPSNAANTVVVAGFGSPSDVAEVKGQVQALSANDLPESTRIVYVNYIYPGDGLAMLTDWHIDQLIDAGMDYYWIHHDAQEQLESGYVNHFGPQGGLLRNSSLVAALENVYVG